MYEQRNAWINCKVENIFQYESVSSDPHAGNVTL